ncbi:DUF397 domain-containing protein [Catenuloplanes japonicus]|uniref:DUF397 domain-containing protein n=1 Tax=Catenuloplanes japonicus TaxID=33876 RepID=UPI0005274CE0|nr:DUF397 domain-containing protein [Catenuloplanes japonicus]
MSAAEDRPEWRTASRSGGGNCVEVARVAGGMGVRDSKDRGGPVLHYTGAAWAAFTRGARSGDFTR